MQIIHTGENGSIIREAFAYQHIRSAMYMAEDALQIEASKDKASFGRHKAYVSGSILVCVAFLEASINEFFCDLEDPNTNHYPELDNEKEKLIAALWEKGVPRTARYSILEKYDFGLILTGNTPLDKSGELYCDIKLLVDLRNALIHFEPEWSSSGDHPAREITKFEKRTRGKFEYNPLMPDGNSFFPARCLSAGCAIWAYKSGISLVRNFYKIIGAQQQLSRFEFNIDQTKANKANHNGTV